MNPVVKTIHFAPKSYCLSVSRTRTPVKVEPKYNIVQNIVSSWQLLPGREKKKKIAALQLHKKESH